MRILIAEDDAISLKILERILAEQGYETIVFRDGKSAFDYLKTHPSPIVISDWMMPEMDGLDLCRRIRELNRPQYTHFIMLTAKAGVENYRQAMQEGVDDFLTKPVNREELAIKLRVTERIILQRQKAEKAIRTLARFPEDNPNPILQVDGQGRIRYANQACLPLLRHWMRHPGDLLPAPLLPLIESAEPGARGPETELACGDQIYSFAVTSVYDEDGAYLYGHNITDRKLAEAELLQLKNQAVQASLHDQLTGLPNRILLQDHLKQGLARCRRDRTRMALIMVDIDNFKTINDSQGHLVGDEVLVLVGQCLRETLRQTDTVCRWGGDELMLLLPGLKDRRCLPAICDKLEAALQQRISASPLRVPVSLSLGYAVFPDDAEDPDRLIQQADYALYQAKAEGRHCWREFKGFTEGLESKGKADLYLRLNDAIQQERIQPYFQPVMDAVTLQVVGLESLARWKDARDGWISPGLFIPLAEEKGLILPLSRQVTLKSLQDLREWRSRAATLTLSFNLSKAQLVDPNFQPWLESVVSDLDLNPAWLILEVTERESLLDHALSRRRLETLSRAGFGLSLDDFGTGYASLDLVAEMPFQELKIPHALIRNVETTKGRRIVQAIVDMATTLGLRVVAEGVETASALACLQEVGVHKLQGFHLAQPMPSPEVAPFLDKVGMTAADVSKAAPSDSLAQPVPNPRRLAA
jgi:diguanylate cyclase (GGDEF)-like protein